MDVTTGKIFDLAHLFQAKHIQNMEASKQKIYTRRYLWRRLAFSLMAANTLRQPGPDLQSNWNLADHDGKLNLGLSLPQTIFHNLPL